MCVCVGVGVGVGVCVFVCVCVCQWLTVSWTVLCCVFAVHSVSVTISLEFQATGKFKSY